MPQLSCAAGYAPLFLVVCAIQLMEKTVVGLPVRAAAVAAAGPARSSASCAHADRLRSLPWRTSAPGLPQALNPCAC
eukprot:scaffold1112_cov116-Isochrysis_galbana.AAC.22